MLITIYTLVKNKNIQGNDILLTLKILDYTIYKENDWLHVITNIGVNAYNKIICYCPCELI